MGRNSALFLFKIIIIILGVSHSVSALASVDKALTIWGPTLKLEGSNIETLKTVGKQEELKLMCVQAMKNYGFFSKAKKPSAEFIVKFSKKGILLHVKSLLANVKLYSNFLPLASWSQVTVRRAINILFGNFYRALPSKGLVFSIVKNEVKVSMGAKQGLRKGQRVVAVRFLGDATDPMALSKDMPYAISAEIVITNVKTYYSVGRIITSSSLERYNKIVVPTKKERIAAKSKKKKTLVDRGVCFYLGFSSGNLSSKSDEDTSSTSITPDGDKELSFLSLVPMAGFSWWLPWNIGGDGNVQYRKLPMKTAGGTEVKATYLRALLDFRYRFDFSKLKGEEYLAVLAGYTLYQNKLTTPLVYYISTQYHGPLLGVQWKQWVNQHAGFSTLKIFPKLLLTEDQVQRGSDSSAYGFYLDIGYEFLSRTFIGFKAILFYQYMKTKYSGVTTHFISPESQNFTESYYGINLFTTFSFF